MSLPPTRWGSDPEFFGPRHEAREGILLDTLLPHLPPGARVLDAGAGAGHMANRLAARGHAVVGVDQSEAFIAHATARAVSGARFQVGDVTRLDFPAGAFEAVVAGEVLEHVAEHVRAVAELYRVLKPGGVCLVSVPADPRLWDDSDDWAGHVRRYTEAELRSLFEGRGFEVVTLFRWGFPLTRLYHRWVYLPMLRRKAGRDSEPSKPLTGWKKGVARALAVAFRGDRLFDGSPWGIGFVLLAKKPA